MNTDRQYSPTEKSMKYANPKSRISIIFRYIMYSIACVIVVDAFVGATLLDHLTFKQIVLYAFPSMLPYVVVLVLPLSLWYGGSRITAIEYDNDSRTLSLWHYNWLFRQKQKEIPLCDLEYSDYHILAPFLFYKIKIIQIADTRRRRTLVFTSGLGWKRKQVDVILNKLREIEEAVPSR
ncbi:MAG: hypothetical protein SPM02_05310 [Bacteroidales bacterium]|nr:hypothetical protein [Bacteroidales bacterium]